MKKHYTSILIMLFFIFFSDSLYAQQPYYTVPATGNGNFTVGNVIVSVTRQGDASTFTCFGNPLPYFQGIRNNGKSVILSTNLLLVSKFTVLFLLPSTI